MQVFSINNDFFGKIYRNFINERKIDHNENKREKGEKK